MATFTNQATLTYNGQTTTSNVTVGELTETLTAAKTAVVPTYGTDGRVTYILSLVNSGTAPLTGPGSSWRRPQPAAGWRPPGWPRWTKPSRPCGAAIIHPFSAVLLPQGASLSW